jgi:hypothetical protein
MHGGAELAELGERETEGSGARGQEDEGEGEEDEGGGETVNVRVQSTGGEEAFTVTAEPPQAGEIGNVAGARV